MNRAPGTKVDFPPKPLVLHRLQSGCEFDDNVSFRHRHTPRDPNLAKLNRIAGYQAFNARRFPLLNLRRERRKKRDRIPNERNNSYSKISHANISFLEINLNVSGVKKEFFRGSRYNREDRSFMENIREKEWSVT